MLDKQKIRSVTISLETIDPRQLAVFRDIQETNDHPTLPTEWNGEKGKKEVNQSCLFFECFHLLNESLDSRFMMMILSVWL